MSEVIEVDVRYDRSNQLKLAEKATPLADLLVSARIADQQSLNIANNMILAANEWLKAVDAIMDPVRDATHKAWKAAIKAQDEFKEPVAKPLALLKSAAAKFISDAREEAARKQREVDAEQARINALEAKQAAAALKEMGATKAEIKEVKEAIKSVQAPVIAPVAEVSSGMSTRTYYSTEITDLTAFFNYAVTNEMLMRILSANVKIKDAICSELNVDAKRFKEAYSVPGVKLVKTVGGAWR